MDQLSKLSNAVIDSTVINDSSFIKAKYVGSEPVDVNLSKVDIGGTTFRFVPKFRHVGSMTVGDLVWLVANGNQYCILGVQIGNVNLATR